MGEPEPEPREPMLLGTLEDGTELRATHKDLQHAILNEILRTQENRRDWERRRLSEFKENAKGLPGLDLPADDKDDEWWMLGRHFGLTSPLLDWTRSPYIAAYFAFEDLLRSIFPHFNTGESDDLRSPELSQLAVWELGIDRTVMTGDFRMVAARDQRAYRQKAQQGVSTHLSHPVHLSVESYLREIGKIELLRRFDIQTDQFVTAMFDLDLMGIHRGTLFPDLEGAAHRANTKKLIDGFGIHLRTRQFLGE